MQIHELDANQGLKRLAKGELSTQEWVNGCLQRIAEREPVVQAWQHLAADAALEQASQREAAIAQKSTAGILHGVPVAVKDNFATADMPTGWGTRLYEGSMLGYDAAAVERLRSAGAVILGKTVLTEYAIARAGKTTNPHNPANTPGGSSSGSAAAVAAGMVPLAIGSQTLGSVLRPAAYCGILGFKPSFGLISRYGLIPVSRDLDQVGVFARSVEDIALLCSALAAPDGRDPDCLGGDGNWTLESTARSPRLALIWTHLWNKLDVDAQERILESTTVLAQAGAEVAEISLPPEFEAFFDHTNVLLSAGVAVNHGDDYDNHFELLSPRARQLVERGRAISPLSYAKARQAAIGYSVALAEILGQFDAIITPVTTGTAPHGLDNTGSPVFCTLWTMCGLPAISLPAGTGENGLPLAVQLVGRRAGDRHLLSIARWAHKVLGDRFG
jgi:Asp-tRNA(Asn)/Glu-tRNA(Gln) amidotransferase A subunit family amidase